MNGQSNLLCILYRTKSRFDNIFEIKYKDIQKGSRPASFYFYYMEKSVACAYIQEWEKKFECSKWIL